MICTSNFNKELVSGNYLFLGTLGKKEIIYLTQSVVHDCQCKNHLSLEHDDIKYRC